MRSDHGYTSPILYKQNERGTLQQWRTWSFKDRVHVEFGQMHGKLQATFDIVKGKNIGRANATTAYQQAAVKARQLYDKKVKQGFIPDASVAQKTKNALGAIQPMLAHIYQENMDKTTWPAFVQPKLDGVRCLAIVKGGKATLYTRAQKLIETVPHINEAVEHLARRTGVKDFMLDGELYNHDLHDDFGKILGLVKRGSTSDEAKLVKYYIYDTPDDGRKPFHMRSTDLEVIEDHTKDVRSALEIVLTIEVRNAADMEKILKSFEGDGYEGAMYRSRDGKYENKRSRHLLKVKSFHGEGVRDEDFKVIGVHPGTGKLMGKVGSFKCTTAAGVEFKAKLEGALDQLPLLTEADKFIGRMLTVKFQNLTPDGVPRFPVGVRFRDEVEA